MKENNINIRAAGKRDAGLILNFIKQLASYEKKKVAASRKDIHTFIFEKKAAEALIAEYGSRAAGFALFFHTFSTFSGKPGIYIEDLFILKKYRNKGIGKALLSCIAGIALQRGSSHIEFSVLKWNKAAKGFYKKAGADAKDEWDIYRIGKEGLDKLASKSRLALNPSKL
ncbi:MAG: N-acetyltransferase family protein [Actinomycetota bacterium]